VLLGLAVWHRRRPGSLRLRAIDVAFIVVLGVPSILWLVRSVPGRLPDAAAVLQFALDLAAFNPPGLAGAIASAAIWAVAPATYLLLVAPLAHPGQRRILSVGVTLAAGLVVLAPVIQYALGSGFVLRPGHRVRAGSGIVGFAHDPHAYAALLGFAACVLVGVGAGVAAKRRLWIAASVFLVAGGAGVEILFTGSIGGAIACGVGMTMVGWLVARRLPPGNLKTAFLVAGCVMAILAVVGGAMSFSLLPGEDFLRGHLVELGLHRTSRILDPETTPLDLVQNRLELAATARALSASSPLWGVGPGQASSPLYTESLGKPVSSENTHNAFLQLGAELGLVALLMWVSIAFLSLRRGVRASGEGGYAMAGLVGGLVSLLIVSLSSNILLLPEGQLVFWGSIAFIAAETRKPRRGEARPASELPT
jgi:hypothetical protein